MKKTKQTHFIFTLFYALSFYSYGTAMMDYFLVYPSRYLVGEREFISYHELLEATIWPISVIPFLLIIILNGFLLWKHAGSNLRKMLAISLVFLVLDFISTVLMQAPWNNQLANGKDLEVMQRITDTNWIRVFLETAQVIVVFFMLLKSTKSE